MIPILRSARCLSCQFKLPVRIRKAHLRSASTRRPPVLNPPSPEVTALLEECLAQPPRQLTLSKFLSYGRPLTQDSVIASAKYVLSEIPRRLARRIRAIENLPFIVGTNPYVVRTLALHRDSFAWLATHSGVDNLEDNKAFSRQLENLVKSHADDIPIIARGFQECGKYMSQGSMSDFLDSTIRSRIAVRMIAEQHIAISQELETSASGHTGASFDGVINQRCSPSEILGACHLAVSDMCEATLGSSPRLMVDGHVDETFPYVPVHLQYILTEMLKNAYRATIERHWQLYGPSTLRDIPPVQVTVASPGKEWPSGRLPHLSIRIRDEGGGVTRPDLSHVFSYAFTTAGRNSSHGDEMDGGPYSAQHVGGSAAISRGIGENSTGASRAGLFAEMTGKGIQTGVGTLAGLGYGLPMSRLYAKYFGGSLDLMTMDGWGTDAIIKLRCLSQESEENVAI